jgi:hypothetical protein
VGIHASHEHSETNQIKGKEDPINQIDIQLVAHCDNDYVDDVDHHTLCNHFYPHGIIIRLLVLVADKARCIFLQLFDLFIVLIHLINVVKLSHQHK